MVLLVHVLAQTKTSHLFKFLPGSPSPQSAPTLAKGNMFELIVMLGTLASCICSLFKLITRLGSYGVQIYKKVAAAPLIQAAHPANPHSVLVIHRTEHTVTARGSTKVNTTNIEFHHDPGQSLQSGMDAT